MSMTGMKYCDQRCRDEISLHMTGAYGFVTVSAVFILSIRPYTCNIGQIGLNNVEKYNPKYKIILEVGLRPGSNTQTADVADISGP